MDGVLSGNVLIDSRRAEALLFPIVAFLRVSGLTKEAIEKSLSRAYKRAAKSTNNRKIKRIGHPMRYAEAMATWVRDKRFLNTAGEPRLLKLKGKTGFAALVRTVSPGSDPSKVLAVLRRFGNVRMLRDGRYKLINPFFIILTPESIALEPTAYFLEDASATIARILTRRKRSHGPDVFWRKVENAKLTAAAARKFLDFTRQRTLTFLEELNDWLEAHCETKANNTKRPLHRVGLGLFYIHAKPGA